MNDYGNSYPPKGPLSTTNAIADVATGVYHTTEMRNEFDHGWKGLEIIDNLFPQSGNEQIKYLAHMLNRPEAFASQKNLSIETSLYIRKKLGYYPANIDAILTGTKNDFWNHVASAARMRSGGDNNGTQSQVQSLARDDDLYQKIVYDHYARELVLKFALWTVRGQSEEALSTIPKNEIVSALQTAIARLEQLGTDTTNAQAMLEQYKESYGYQRDQENPVPLQRKSIEREDFDIDAKENAALTYWALNLTGHYATGPTQIQNAVTFLMQGTDKNSYEEAAKALATVELLSYVWSPSIIGKAAKFVDPEMPAQLSHEQMLKRQINDTSSFEDWHRTKNLQLIAQGMRETAEHFNILKLMKPAAASPGVDGDNNLPGGKMTKLMSVAAGAQNALLPFLSDKYPSSQKNPEHKKIQDEVREQMGANKKLPSNSFQEFEFWKYTMKKNVVQLNHASQGHTPYSNPALTVFGYSDDRKLGDLNIFEDPQGSLAQTLNQTGEPGVGRLQSSVPNAALGTAMDLRDAYSNYWGLQWNKVLPHLKNAVMRPFDPFRVIAGNEPMTDYGESGSRTVQPLVDRGLMSKERQPLYGAGLEMLASLGMVAGAARRPPRLHAPDGGVPKVRLGDVANVWAKTASSDLPPFPSDISLGAARVAGNLSVGGPLNFIHPGAGETFKALQPYGHLAGVQAAQYGKSLAQEENEAKALQKLSDAEFYFPSPLRTRMNADAESQ